MTLVLNGNLNEAAFKAAAAENLLTLEDNSSTTLPLFPNVAQKFKEPFPFPIRTPEDFFVTEMSVKTLKQGVSFRYFKRNFLLQTFRKDSN